MLNLQLHRMAKAAYKSNLFIKNQPMFPLTTARSWIIFSLWGDTVLFVNLPIIDGKILKPNQTKLKDYKNE